MTDPTREGSDATAALDVPDAAAPATIGRASAMLAAGTIVSRILGFISLAILNYAIGVIGTGADAFALANQLPNNIYSLVAGGLLSAVIVPQIVKSALHSDGGTAFINRLVTLGVVVFLPLTLIAVLCAPLLVRLYGGEGMNADAFALTTAFAYWCLPQIVFYALYSLVGETLNARGVFGPFTWAPVLNNLVAIAGLILFIALFGAGEQHRDAANWTSGQIAVLAGSATLGIAVQAFGLFFFWRRAGLRYRPDFRWRGVGLGDTGRAAAWVFGMFLVSQVSGVVESRVAFEASGDDASVNALKVGWLMFMLPHSVVTVSIVTAYFTRMSGHARDGRLTSVRDDLVSALKSILMIMVFAAIGLAVLSYPFSAIFSQSQYSGVSALAAVYVAFLTGLVPFTIFFVLLRVYYAIDDTRTAFVIQVAQTVFYIAGALIVQALAPKEWIAVGLALVLSAALAFQAILSALFLRRRLGPLGTAQVAGRVLWYIGAAIPAAAAGVGVLALLGGVGSGAFPVTGLGGAIASMALTGAVMAAIYAAILLLTRNPELRAFVQPALARIRPSRRRDPAE